MSSAERREFLRMSPDDPAAVIKGKILDELSELRISGRRLQAIYMDSMAGRSFLRRTGSEAGLVPDHYCFYCRSSIARLGCRVVHLFNQQKYAGYGGA